MSDYPEHRKLLAVAEQSQAVGEFLEWAMTSEGGGWHLARIIPGQQFTWETNGEPINTLLARHFGIDLKALELEKRAMLAEFEAASRASQKLDSRS
ncbi:MAG: hypothetical protein JWO15_3740 [Sphingomonadales bacterium]|nr:hypothetical protein [Sphingomonadales bacterium]